MDARAISFLHSGDMGDIVAGLAAVKEFCALRNADARLLLDTSGGWHDAHCVKDSKGLGMKFDENAAKFLTPLLEAQPFVRSVEIWDGKESAYVNLNEFRRGFARPWRAETGCNLLYCHQKALGLPLRYPGPWLADPGPSPFAPCEWLAARSTRYHSSDQIYKKHLDEIDAFLGLPLESQCFHDCFRKWAPRGLVAGDALDLARAVKASKNFIVNGTLAYWIALGIGHPHIVHEVGVDIKTTVFREDIPGLEYAQGKGVRPREELD